MKRAFQDLVPGRPSLAKRLRKLLSGGTVAGLALSPAVNQAAEVTTLPASDPQSFTIVNREQKARKLLLRMPTGATYRMLQHKSHSSHSSHSSHASHYSGSSGTATSSPATPPRPVTAVPSPPAEVPPPKPDVTVIQSFTGSIDAVNKELRTLTVKMASGLKYTMSYRDDTTFTPLGGEESRLDDTIERAHGKLPFEVGHRVRVQWKAGTAGKTIATAITRVQ